MQHPIVCLCIQKVDSPIPGDASVRRGTIKDDERKEGKKKSFSLTKGSNFADYGLGILVFAGAGSQGSWWVEQKSHNSSTEFPVLGGSPALETRICAVIGPPTKHSDGWHREHHEPYTDDVTPAAFVGREPLSLVERWGLCVFIRQDLVSSLHRRTGCVTCAQPYPVWAKLAAHSLCPAM